MTQANTKINALAPAITKTDLTQTQNTIRREDPPPSFQRRGKKAQSHGRHEASLTEENANTHTHTHTHTHAHTHRNLKEANAKIHTLKQGETQKYTLKNRERHKNTHSKTGRDTKIHILTQEETQKYTL